MLQSGYPVDFILALSVESLNGVRNRTAAGRRVREADPDFVRALQLLRNVQLAGGVGMRVEEDQAKRSTAVLYFQHDDMPAETREKAAEVRRPLRLPEGQQKFVLSYSPLRGERARREQSPLCRYCRHSRGTLRYPSRTYGKGAPRRPSSTRRRRSGPVDGHSGPARPVSAYVAVSTGEGGSG
jgi:hypothetical protein